MVAPNGHNGYQTYHESSTYASYNIISPNENTAENIEICFVHPYTTCLESKSKDTCTSMLSSETQLNILS